MTTENSSIYSSHQSSIQVMSFLNNEELSNHDEQMKCIEPSNNSKPKSRYRMRICDAPPELLELIKYSKEKYENPLPNKSSSVINAPILSNSIKNVPTTSVTSNDLIPNFHKIISANEKRHRIRKNSFPKRSPSRSSPGITLQVDVYTTFKENPRALLQGNELQTTYSSPTSSNSSSILSLDDVTDDSFSDAKSIPPPHNSISRLPLPRNQIIKTKTKAKTIMAERKRMGNSLARVMADFGLLDLTSTPISIAEEIRVPPPPPMQFDELIKSIKQLNLDSTLLQRINPKISWKGQPLPISHLPHYNSLHQKEAHVVSTLRLTPIQYLTGKYTLISTARRYVQKSLAFSKSDAQKLLRIDVNKASKLWEFFAQVKWI